MIVRARDQTVRRGRRVVLSVVSFAIAAGAGVRLVGADGSAKTSLLRVRAGLAHPHGGRLERPGRCAFVPEKVTPAPALRCGEWLGTVVPAGRRITTRAA